MSGWSSRRVSPNIYVLCLVYWIWWCFCLCRLMKRPGIYLAKSKAHSAICINTENFHCARHFDEEGAHKQIIYSRNIFLPLRWIINSCFERTTYSNAFDVKKFQWIYWRFSQWLTQKLFLSFHVIFVNQLITWHLSMSTVFEEEESSGLTDTRAMTFEQQKHTKPMFKWKCQHCEHLPNTLSSQILD